VTVAALAQGLTSRPAVADDVPAVAAIESAVFPDPWPAHLYQQELDQPLRFQRVVTTERGEVTAYLFGCWQVDELHVLKVACHPLYEGRGLATSLLAEAVEEVQRRQGRGVILEVRPTNLRAVRLYRHLGYHVLARRPRYYADGEDALVMFLETSRSTGWQRR
jgi:ribosomal-protein-alanine N-acetyltransferase